MGDEGVEPPTLPCKATGCSILTELIGINKFDYSFSAFPILHLLFSVESLNLSFVFFKIGNDPIIGLSGISFVMHVVFIKPGC